MYFLLIKVYIVFNIRDHVYLVGDLCLTMSRKTKKQSKRGFVVSASLINFEVSLKKEYKTIRQGNKFIRKCKFKKLINATNVMKFRTIP